MEGVGLTRAPPKKPAKEPTPPTRLQPERTSKRTSEYTAADFGTVPPLRRPKTKPVAFIVEEPPRIPVSSLASAGRGRRELAEAIISTTTSAQIDNGTPPRTMSFGANEGCGAGFYDGRGNVVHVGTGSTDWYFVEEVSPEEPKKVMPCLLCLHRPLRPARARSTVACTS